MAEGSMALLGPILALALTSVTGSAATSDDCSAWCSHDSVIDGRLKEVELKRVPRAPNPYIYRYTNQCFPMYHTRVFDLCNRDRVIPPPDEPCANGGMLIYPRWSRIAEDPDATWTLEANFTCPGDPNYPITAEDFTSLPVSPSTLAIQPNTGWVYAGLETIAYADGMPQGFLVNLLGVDFAVVALPDEYTWDFDDGSDPFVTADPGAPWPNHSVAHVYSASGTVTPSLTTQWKGYVRPEGATSWSPIDGVSTTTTTGPTITVHTARTHLVEDSLD